MKYPQLVSMPSAVQDWLDEQLEARGIDAVVYTRYILSLLQRDTLDLPDDFLAISSNKVREVGRRGRKRGRNREEYWDVWDCEQLKRSAAVECLMSASDQKCGIEKLVDELCAKLKEIQSEGEKSTHLEFPSEAVPSKQSHIPSPQDQVQKYYAAFPPLNSKFADSSTSLITLIPEPGSAWNSKKVLANSFGKNKPCYTSLQETSSSEEKLLVGTTGWGEENKENRGEKNSLWKEFGRESMKCGNQVKENAKGNKEAVFGFLWNMAGEWNGSYTDVYPGEGCGNSGSDLIRIFHCNRQNKGSRAGEGVMPEKELQAHRESDCENGACRRLYERQTGEGNCAFSGPVDSEKEELQNGCTAGDDDTACSTSPGQSAEDQNLAQLIAKFDHSIEALWNPDEVASPGNFSSEENLDCNQELPLDFQQLLSSPNKQYLTVELYNLNCKRNQNVFPTNNSFIQCGTNITSSIWSDQPSMENSFEQDDFGMDYTQYEQQNTSDHCGDSKVKLADVCCNEMEMMGDKYTLLVTGEGKIVGNKFRSEEQLKANKCEEKDHSDSLFKNSDILEIGTCCDVPVSEEKCKATWNKYDNFSSFFTSLPWAVNCTVADITQGAQSEKVSSVMSSGTHGTYSHFGSIFPNDYGNMSNSIKSHTDVLNDSLITLNHNREDSSFTEVIPKQNSLCGLLAGRLDSGTVQEKKESVSAEQVCHLDTVDVGGPKGGKLDVEREEEDLLTSTRTHFRPIHMESMESHLSINAGNSNNVGSYADGTTFVIPTSLEEVAFKRSESGTLYLEAEADAGLQTPNRYMEYKEKEPYGCHHRYEERSQGVGENSREFVPKFRVRQNEKWCQTEEEGDMLQSDEEVDTKRIRQGNNSAEGPEDFYFPDDDHFAEKINNSLEDSSENTTETENRKSFSTHHLEKDIYMSHNSSVLKHNLCLQRENKIISSLGSVSSNGVIPKIQNNSSCQCSSNGYHLQMWKTAWPKSSQVPGQRVWESTESGGPQSWYNIWKMSPGPSGHLCQCDVFPHVDVVVPQSLLSKESDCGGTETRSLQYSRLREELTMEGEQLLSDLSYMQHLYQGSDWQDDAAEAEESVPDWGPEQEETDGDQKLRFLSPAEDSTQEMMMYAEDAGCTRIVPACQSLVKQRKSVDDLGPSYSAITSPRTALLSTDLEEEGKHNERPLNAMAIQKDRKRRHSASQRACSYYLEGSCRRPHCRFSHDLATVPCRFWADSSCLKGIACPFLHGNAQALRPVTL